MIRTTLRAAGFREDCPDCREASSYHREACDRHYVPTHERDDPNECTTCGGTKRPEADACRRCFAAGVR